MEDGRVATIPFAPEAGPLAGQASESASKIAFAHTLRGWAAVAVAISHLGFIFWIAPEAIAGLTHLPAPTPVPEPPAIARVLTDLTKAVPGVTDRFAPGPFGVGLFFLISGFVIPFSFRRQSRAGFLAGRVLRLWPTYAAGLSVTLLAIFAGALLEGKEFPFSAKHVLVHYVLGLRDLLWMPSIDGIVWTLEIEVKFYLLCACVAPWLTTGRVRVFYALAPVLLGIVLLLGTQFEAWARGPVWRFGLAWVAAVDSQMILYMLVGTAYHYLYRGRIGAGHTLGLVAGLYAASVVAGFSGYARGNAPTIACSQGAALVLFSACYALRDRFKGGGVSGWLADVSYPLYAVHGVAGYVLMNLLIRRVGLGAEATLAIASVAAVLLAWGIHHTVERPTHRLATRVARALSPVPSAPAPVAAERARAA